MGGGEVVKKGYLTKSPPLDGKMKNWHKRFFCLFTSKILEYYKTEGGERKGLINLEDCTSVNSGLSHKKYQHVFNIETTDRTYYLVASTQEEMMDWVETLCKVCEFISADEEEEEVPPPVNPRSLSLTPQSTNNPPPPVPGISKTRSGSLHSGRGLPPTPLQESLYSLAGQDASQQQQQKSATLTGLTLSDYFSQSGQIKKLDGDQRSSSTSNGGGPPPPGIPLNEALSMKGYGPQGQQATVGPAVPPRTPLNDALQIKGFSQMPVTEGDSASSTTSLAMEAEREVKRILKQQSFGDVQVKPGTPLNEALAQKGISSLPQSRGNSRTSVDSFSMSHPGPRSVSEDPSMESHYSYPPNNRLAYPQSNEQEEHYKSPRSSLLESGHYQSPRSLSVDDPDQTYNVPPPPRRAPPSRTSSTKKSMLLNQGSSEPVNGGVSAPPVNRSAKPRPPEIDRSTKPPSSKNLDNEVPQSTQNTVHYVSLQKLRVTNGASKPVPRPRSAQRTDYTQVSIEDTLEMQKRMTEKNQPPQPPPPRSTSLPVETFSSDDDEDSTDSEVSYTRMRGFTFEEADKPDTYYQSPRRVLQEEEDFDDPRQSLPTGR